MLTPAEFFSRGNLTHEGNTEEENNSYVVSQISTDQLGKQNGGGWGEAMDEGTIKIPIPKCRLYWYFCLAWCSNFVGSESGQEQSVKLLQNMVYNTNQHPPPPPPQPLTVLYVGGKGWGGQREGTYRGNSSQKRSKILT